MNKISLYKPLFIFLNSKYSPIILVLFCFLSFIFGQISKDMNIFASSGAVMTIFGLISMIKFTTIHKFLNKKEIIAASTGVTSPPLTPEQNNEYVKKYQKNAEIKIQKELDSELKGISLTIIGTLIWAYGSYVPVLTQALNT